MVVFAAVKSISEPFNVGRTIEVKLVLENGEGEIYLRVSTDRKAEFRVGQIFVVPFNEI